MSAKAGFVPVLKALAGNPQILKVKPSLSLFLLAYMRKFRVARAGKNLVLHSHLPPINSDAYARFIDEHLLRRSDGPSHAQIGLTNACPQRCAYCYNRDRRGVPMGKNTILKTIDDLRRLGVFWLGLTGGEPLLNKDIVEITEKAANRCAVKLFTTGCALTPGLASDLKNAGLFSVSVSLDDWREDVHDATRGYPGAFRTALEAIETFKEIGGIHVGVSAVLSVEMIRTGRVEPFIDFLEGLGIDEAWLSETKPSVQPYWNKDLVITEEERRGLAELQDRRNRKDGLTVNYLAHFEGPEHFGCNAGHKMVYVDPFGDVSPCVFTPMTFGNVFSTPVGEIWRDMRRAFSPGSSCFMNKNFDRLQMKTGGTLPLGKADCLSLLRDVDFGSPGSFFRLFYGKSGRASPPTPRESRESQSQGGEK